MTQDERMVYSVLNFHRGRESAIGKANLSATTGIGERVMRKVIKRLIETHHVRIGSTPEAPAGYFIIETAEEADQCSKRLYRQSLSMLKRMSVLRRMSADELCGQLKFDLMEKPSGRQGLSVVTEENGQVLWVWDR